MEGEEGKSPLKESPGNQVAPKGAKKPFQGTAQKTGQKRGRHTLSWKRRALNRPATGGAVSQPGEKRPGLK